MHAPDGGLEGDIASAADGRSTRHVNQSDADRCCGLSEQRDDPAPSAVSGTFVVPIGRLTTPVALVVQLDVARPETHRKPRADAVPRHLLLSVLLV